MKVQYMALTAALALSLAACGKDDGSGDVLATVNGEKIYESQVAEQLATIPENLLQGREAEVRRQVLEGLIQQELLQQEAEKAKVAKTEEYKTQLAAAERQLAANLVVAKKVSETVTAEALQSAYDATKAQRAFPAVKAKHILVPTEQQARDLIKIATPGNFSTLAKQYSKGPSAETGGDLGWFRREAMIPEFAAIAFSTPVGTVASSPVQTQFGWHVILVEDRNEQYVPPMDQVSPQLKAEMTQTVVQGYLAELRKNATISYKDGLGEPSPTDVSPTN